MTYSPVTRLLTALDLLQARSSVTAAQLAERLEVDTRSVRRYMTMLQDMGIPVEAERGRYGGYRLRSSFKLPPLMWTEEEALAITLGLRAARHLGISQAAPAIESALAKVERVLPTTLRERVQAVQETVVLDLVASSDPEASQHILLLSTAARQRTSVQMRYQSRLNEESTRLFDCYGLVYHEQHWYAIGYCHLRQDTRVFRLDRILALEPGTAHFTPPAHFDCLAYANQAFAAWPERWRSRVLLQADLTTLRQIVPAAFATLEETPEGVLFSANDNDLQHAARFLVNLGCPLRVLEPPELREELRKLARTILDWTENDPSS